MRNRSATATPGAISLVATLALTLGLAAAPAAAAPKKFIIKDQSSAILIDTKVAHDILEAAVPGDRMHKVYNNLRWGFASQVEGGLTQTGTCVITARVMLLPATVGKSLLFNPSKKVTVFDAVPNSSREKCAEQAAVKLKEAADAMVHGLLK